MNIDLENYKRLKKWKQILFRKYKIYIKWIWCNAKCPMCNDWKEIWDYKNIISSLYKVIINIIKDPAEKKHIEILWWEPLLIFEDLYKIIYLCNKYNIDIEFPTNWSLLDLKKIHILLKSWLKSFTFSIDYPNENHDKFRKINWSYKKIIEHSKYLKDNKIKVKWNTVIWKHNIKFINDFWKIYNIISPDIHNYIYLEDINLFSKQNITHIEEIIKDIQKLQKDYTLISFSLANEKINQKDKEILLNSKYKEYKNKKCFIPLLNKVYFIDWKWNISISPCSVSYTNTNTNILLKNEKDYNNFIKQILNNNCSKCDLKNKSHFNYILNSIIN